MRKTVQADDVEFNKVDWGLTKNLVGPESMGSEMIFGKRRVGNRYRPDGNRPRLRGLCPGRSPACNNQFKRLRITNSNHY